MAWRPRLRTVLVIVNIVILALPLGGIAVLRLYESALVRQTESELIAQGAFVAATYKAALVRTLNENVSGQITSLEPYGVLMASEWMQEKGSTERWQPRAANLDLAVDQIQPPPPDAIRLSLPADPAATVAGRDIMPVIQDAQVVTLASIRVMDYKGIVVASTGEELDQSLANWNEVARALAGEHVSSLRARVSDEPIPPLHSISRGARVRVFVAMPIVQEDRVLGAVMLSRTPANIAHALYGKRYPLFYGVLVLLIVVFAVSLFTSFTISRPVSAVINQAKRAARGEKGAVTPLEQPVTREIAELSDAVAQMARTLEQRADYIRDFASHVSHEFKTPLTSIQGALELLHEHADTMSEMERNRFLKNLTDDAAHLERLVKRLLDLARADVMRVGEETANVTHVLERAVERYRRLGLTVNIEPTSKNVIVTMSPEILESIVSNLLDNARQHGGDDVTVTIRLDQIQPNDKAHAAIVITDDGPGISEANTARVFKPFFTTARARDGTGLGLAVVRSLITAHDGSIRLRPSNVGAAFELQLPVTSNAS
ncbi:MAG: HAMP domain-containing histidine kinase [Gammaproteobacteria bacterium]|nr:HAMP domain-containing histidine kinase [Gammaproteobacteria bacterium]